MNLFDIVGPVMVGPSSSHTAGAVRIGFVAQKLLGEPVKRARIGLYGSFGNGNRTRNPESADCGTFRNGAGRHADSGQLSPGRGERD